MNNCDVWLKIWTPFKWSNQRWRRISSARFWRRTRRWRSWRSITNFNSKKKMSNGFRTEWNKALNSQLVIFNTSWDLFLHSKTWWDLFFGYFFILKHFQTTHSIYKSRCIPRFDLTTIDHSYPMSIICKFSINDKYGNVTSIFSFLICFFYIEMGFNCISFIIF